MNFSTGMMNYQLQGDFNGWQIDFTSNSPETDLEIATWKLTADTRGLCRRSNSCSASSSRTARSNGTPSRRWPKATTICPGGGTAAKFIPAWFATLPFARL